MKPLLQAASLTAVCLAVPFLACGSSVARTVAVTGSGYSAYTVFMSEKEAALVDRLRAEAPGQERGCDFWTMAVARRIGSFQSGAREYAERTRDAVCSLYDRQTEDKLRKDMAAHPNQHSFSQLAAIYGQQRKTDKLAALCETTLPTTKSGDERYRVLDQCFEHSGANTVEGGLRWASAEDIAFYRGKRAQAEHKEASEAAQVEHERALKRALETYDNEVVFWRSSKRRDCDVPIRDVKYRAGTCVELAACNSKTSGIPGCCLLNGDTRFVTVPGFFEGLPDRGSSIGHCVSQLFFAEEHCAAGSAAMCRLAASIFSRDEYGVQLPQKAREFAARACEAGDKEACLQAIQDIDSK